MTREELIVKLVSDCLSYEKDGQYDQRDVFLQNMGCFMRLRVLEELKKMRESALDM
jgi:hypothetical protein